MPRIIAISMCTVGLGLVILLPIWSGRRLLLQPSASLPRGVYWQRPVQRLAVGVLVSADLAPPVQAFAAARGYLRAGWVVLKPVAALPGATVCWHDAVLTIDGAMAGTIVATDHLGRAVPRFYGCVVLRDAVLLLSDHSPWSWDGRYFGPTPIQALRGEATLLWSWETTQERRVEVQTVTVRRLRSGVPRFPSVEPGSRVPVQRRF